MRRVLLFLLVLAITAVASQSASGRPNAPVLRGVVVDASGQPIEGARVWQQAERGGCFFVPGRSYAARTTRRGGAFELTTPDRTARIYVEHPDHGPSWVSATDGMTVRLPEPAWVTGDLPDGAVVRVTRGVFPVATHRAEGSFRCGPLPPDERLTLVVDSPRHRLLRQALILGRGEVRPLVLRLDSGHHLEGRLDPPVAGVEIRASQGEARQSVAFSSDDGSFRLAGLREGAVQVIALLPGRTPHILRTRTDERSVRVEWSR